MSENLFNERITETMTKKYLAFDIEIAKLPPENEDWKAHRPLGITCAAAISNDGGLWNWYAQEPQDGRFAATMTGEQCRQMVNDLSHLADRRGYTLLTWNGLGFDFDILAEESGLFEVCKRLAISHVDLMFQIFCEKGYPLGLDAASKGMGLPGKPQGMDGAKAPVMWAEGQYHKVLDYVTWDVKNTLNLALAVEARGALNWISRSGRPNQCEMPVLLPVQEAMHLPQPDTSWMTDPWPRSKFHEWTTEVEREPEF